MVVGIIQSFKKVPCLNLGAVDYGFWIRHRRPGKLHELSCFKKFVHRVGFGPFGHHLYDMINMVSAVLGILPLGVGQIGGHVFSVHQSHQSIPLFKERQLDTSVPSNSR